MTKQRCKWSERDPMETIYHDEEWGVPIRDSRMLWECLMLEGFQAGLSWTVILRKRENFRDAFLGFNPEKVARFADREIDLLLANPGIVRSRAKIAATIQGARIYIEMQQKGEDFASFCWQFTDGKTLHGDGRTFHTETELSKSISKELKRRGFKFVGPSITYAWMQAVGMVNDHAWNCFRRNEISKP